MLTAPVSTATRCYVTGWSAVSPFGVGRAAFVEGLLRGVRTAVAPDPAHWRVADTSAHLVPGFTVAGELGRKGTRSLDRLTGLAVTGVRELLAEVERDGGTPVEPDAGLVLASAGGSVQSMMDFTRDGLEGEKPYLVDPARFPNAVMNRAAGACAIWHQLQGPNATIAGGRVSGLHALRYTSRLLRAGRARTVVCAAAEEYSTGRSWLERRTREGARDVRPLGEGCAALRIEARRGGPDEAGLPEVLAVEFGGFGDEGPGEVLAETVGFAMRRAGVGPEDVWCVADSGAGGELGDQETRAVAALCADRPVVRLSLPLGDLAGATPLFQLAAALVLAGREPRASGRVALITAVDRDGQAGCALVRLP